MRQTQRHVNLWPDVRLQSSELWESSLPTKHTPEGRWGHSWTKIADSRAILFGGRDTHVQYNDVHLFEAEEHVWQEIFPRGRAPLPCFHHAACTIGHPDSHKRQSVPPSVRRNGRHPSHIRLCLGVLRCIYRLCYLLSVHSCDSCSFAAASIRWTAKRASPESCIV